MPAHRTQNSRHLRVEAAPIGAPPINIISPTPQTFIFDTDAINAQASEADSYPFASQASRSLPNIFTFHASPNGEYNPYRDSNSPTGSQTSSMYTTYTDSPTSISSSFFASPAHSLYGSSYASSPPESPGTPSLSPSPPPLSSPAHSQSSTDGDRSAARSSSPAPYPFPLPPHSNGQVRTQPPRPPNPWICFRNVRSAQYKELNYPELPKFVEGRGHSAPSSPSTGTLGIDGESVRRPRQADLSKHISLEWKSLTDEEKAPFVRMSEEAKLVHARIYPGYKYQPRRKLEGSSGGKKSTLRPEVSKKSSKTKKSGKSNKGTKKGSEVKAHDQSSEQVDSQTQTPQELDGAQIQLPSLGIDVGVHGQEADPSAGDPSKEWTWLPEQTLLPITWDIDQEPGSGTAADDVMHPLDANIDEKNENDEIEFGKPFYISFPPMAHAPEDQSNLAPFFPFPAESESDPAFFAVPNYDFQASSLGLQDNHMDGFSNISQLPDRAVEDIANEFANDLGFRRGSISSAGYEPLEPSDSYFPLSSESMGESLGFTSADFYASYADAPLSSGSSVQALSADSPALRAVPASLSPLDGTTPVPDMPHPPRRSSVVTQPQCASQDGLLRPPFISQARSKEPSRPINVPARRSSLNARSDFDDVRSIPTTSFGSSSGITTSVLIPMTAPRYDMDLERDLEEYSRALGSMSSDTRTGDDQAPPTTAPEPTTVGTGSSKARATRSQTLEDGDLDLNAEFDFEAEFGDIIDIHASRARSASA